MQFQISSSFSSPLAAHQTNTSPSHLFIQQNYTYTSQSHNTSACTKKITLSPYYTTDVHCAGTCVYTGTCTHTCTCIYNVMNTYLNVE